VTRPSFKSLVKEAVTILHMKELNLNPNHPLNEQQWKEILSIVREAWGKDPRNMTTLEERVMAMKLKVDHGNERGLYIVESDEEQPGNI